MGSLFGSNSNRPTALLRLRGPTRTRRSYAHHVRQSIARSCQWHTRERPREGEAGQTSSQPSEVLGSQAASKGNPQEELVDGPQESQEEQEGALHRARRARSSYRRQARTPPPPGSPREGRGCSEAQASQGAEEPGQAPPWSPHRRQARSSPPAPEGEARRPEAPQAPDSSRRRSAWRSPPQATGEEPSCLWPAP